MCLGRGFESWLSSTLKNFSCSSYWSEKFQNFQQHLRKMKKEMITVFENNSKSLISQHYIWIFALKICNISIRYEFFFQMRQFWSFSNTAMMICIPYSRGLFPSSPSHHFFSSSDRQIFFHPFNDAHKGGFLTLTSRFIEGEINGLTRFYFYSFADEYVPKEC